MRVGKDVSVEELERDYDAIFWGIGAQTGRSPSRAGADAENCITGVEFLDAFNRGWVFSTAKKRSWSSAAAIRRSTSPRSRVASAISTLTHQHDTHDASTFGYTAHDVAGALRREGAEITLTSLFPIEQMTAAEHEREDAKREGVDIQRRGHAAGSRQRAKTAARWRCACKCTMKGNRAAADRRHGIRDRMRHGDFRHRPDGGPVAGASKSSTADAAASPSIPVYKVRKLDKHFAGGDAVRPHLLTTAIGHGRVAAQTMDHFLAGALEEKRPKVDVHQFNLLAELHARNLDPLALRPYADARDVGSQSSQSTITRTAAPRRSSRTRICSRAFQLRRAQQAAGSVMSSPTR